MSGRTAFVLAAMLMVAACSRGAALGTDEAVEILVLDGLERTEAMCLVDSVADRLDLEEVTGVGGDLDAEELMVLVEASRSCQPAAGPASAGVVGGSLVDLEELEELEFVESIDVEGLVADLLRGGLDPETAVCVASALVSGPDPDVAISDETRKIDAIVTCETG